MPKPTLEKTGSRAMSTSTLGSANHSAFSMEDLSYASEELPQARPVTKFEWAGVSSGQPDWPQAKGVHTLKKELMFESAVKVRRRRSIAESHISPSHESAGWLRRVNTWPVTGANTNSFEYLSSVHIDKQITMTSSEWHVTKSKSFTLGQKSVSFDSNRDRRLGWRERGAFWNSMLDVQRRLQKIAFFNRGTSNVSSLYSSVSSLATSFGSALLSIGTFLQDIFIWNEELVNIFSAEGSPLGGVGFGVVFFTIFVINALILVSFTDFFGCATDVYLFLIQRNDLWLPLIGIAALGLILLHLLEIYDWECSLLAKSWLCVLMIVFAFGGLLCTTKTHPEMPLIVGNLHLPLFILVLRLTTIGRWASIFFHIAVNRCTLAISGMTFVFWLFVVASSQVRWGDQSEDRLNHEMFAILQEYGLEDWSQCLSERNKLHPNEDVVASCDRVHLIAFLLWTCPGIQTLVLLSICLLVSLRTWHLKTTLEEQGDRVIQRIVFFAILMTCCFWIAVSVVASSVGLSNTLLPILATASVVCGIWVITSTRFRDLARQVKGCSIWVIAQPFLTSDWVKALIFCLLNVFVILFFLLEFFTRRVQLLREKPGPNTWTTSRGAWMLRLFGGWNWFIVLERAWVLATIFVAGFVLGVRTLLVFLSWLNSQMLQCLLWQALLIFYGAGLVLCLNPFAPFILIYMAAGAVIVARVRDDIGFTWGIVCASSFCLALKLVASVMQHKILGTMLGKYKWVQSLVGVRTIFIRAFEFALKDPDASATKVAILCGTPDWPTSVLAGILKVPIGPMLVGTLPVFFLIVPPVIAGACLLDPDLQKVTPLVLLLMSVANGSVFVAAIVLTLRLATERQLEFSASRCSHACLNTLDSLSARLSLKKFKISENHCLVLGVAIQLACCWVTCFVPTQCFRPFDLHSSVTESFENGGLEDNFFNLFLPLGMVVCIALVVSTVFFAVHLVFKEFLYEQMQLEADAKADKPPYQADRSKPLATVPEERERTSSNESSYEAPKREDVEELLDDLPEDRPTPQVCPFPRVQSRGSF